MSDRKHWRVSVETSGETIVSIEPEMLAGREISDEDEVLIRTAAHHLLSFIGDPTPPPQHIVMGSRWRAFEDTTHGYWGIEREQASNDDDPIMYSIKIHRERVAIVVDAHNAEVARLESLHRSEIADMAERFRSVNVSEAVKQLADILPSAPAELVMGSDDRCATYEDILRVVCGHLELPQSESGPADDVRLYDRALEAMDEYSKKADAELAKNTALRFKAEAQVFQLRKVVDELKFALFSSDMTIKDRADQSARLALAALSSAMEGGE